MSELTAPAPHADHPPAHPRLLHHFDAPEPRRALLRELSRVARRAIVASFWDAGTARARRIARRGASSGRCAVSQNDLAAEIRAAGLEAARFYRLCGLWSPLAAVVITTPGTP